VAGRFALFTDACVDGHVVEAVARRGWDVMRAIDVSPQGTKDPVVFARAAQEGRVFSAQPGVGDLSRSSYGAFMRRSSRAALRNPEAGAS
jgi:hypothetical protein